MQAIDLETFNTQIPYLLEQAAQGEEIVIIKNSQPFVKIMPITQKQPHPTFGSAKGLIEITDDFDEPLDDFKDYI